MQSGKLDQRIVVSVRNRTGSDSFGQDVFGAPTTTELWAHVGFMSGRELIAAGQRWAEARYKITIRRQPGVQIRPEDSITWSGLTLDILDVQGPGTRMPTWTIIAKDHGA